MKPETKIVYVLAVTMFSLCGIHCDNSQDPPPDLFGYSFISYDTVNTRLSKNVRETSGIIKVDNQYWTHNDSGNKSSLYQIDLETGSILNELPIKNVLNKDWEDITQDSAFVYIGDFGNNLGSREDLVIYKFEKRFLDSTTVSEVESIQFSFPDQTKFAYSYNHNFDVESVLIVQDSLFIFTKNWANKQCKLYYIPNQPGKQEALFISKFDTKGLITSAAYDASNKLVVLLGYNYNNYNTPFVWLLSNYKFPNFFSGQKTRFNLDLDRQVEAICFGGDGQYILTSEKGSDKTAAAFQLRL